mmetsp:Transcript_30183/g.59249  ORF Transcript_30183/g.59249 Transcript_30183/m.59249 type:complete len:256 (-) Transcript_30183:1330-2097(-)
MSSPPPSSFSPPHLIPFTSLVVLPLVVPGGEADLSLVVEVESSPSPLSSREPLSHVCSHQVRLVEGRELELLFHQGRGAVAATSDAVLVLLLILKRHCVVCCQIVCVCVRPISTVGLSEHGRRHSPVVFLHRLHEGKTSVSLRVLRPCRLGAGRLGPGRLCVDGEAGGVGGALGPLRHGLAGSEPNNLGAKGAVEDVRDESVQETIESGVRALGGSGGGGQLGLGGGGGDDGSSGRVWHVDVESVAVERGCGGRG